MDERLTAFSLFSGAGGLDIGVAQAGFDIKGCVELDRNCCATLRENIKRTGSRAVVFEGDIAQFEPEDLMRATGIRPGELALLFGGPPCQAFSQIGKQRSLSDDRGVLLYQMTRYAKAFRPRCIMVEQVKGLLRAKDLEGRAGGVFAAFLRQLEELGYAPQWRVMLAANFGVAQLRERVLVVAVKKPDAYSFPEPTHDAPDKCCGLFPLSPYKTVGQALDGLAAPWVKAEGQPMPGDSHYDITPRRDRERIHGVPEGKNLSSQTQLPKDQICGLTKKDSTKFLRVDRSRPANTLRGGEIFFHPIEDRYLTPREYMRIHGYPDDYVLCGPIRGRSGTVKDLDQHRQVANSVPPPLAKAVAEKIKETIECPKSTNCWDTR